MSRLSKIIIFIVLSTSLFSCKNGSEVNPEINIVVSIPPYADFARQIVGSKANVFSVIPPGIDAHSFEPTPVGMKQIIEADIYFRVGRIFNFENLFIEKIGLENINEIVDCSRQIKIEENNPHIWLSPKNVKAICQDMLNSLVEFYPQHKTFFINNSNRFIARLDSIDLAISNLLKYKKEKTVFVYHPAWQYLVSHYGLNELSIEQDGKKPKAKDLKNFIELAKDKGVSCIFFDPHFDDGSVITIAKSIGLEVDSLDPLPSDYLNNLIEIGEKLNRYLK